MQSRAATVEDYLAELPEDRRDVVRQVLGVVRDAMPDGYEELMLFGMPTWAVPLERCPATYNGQPLAYVSLAAQKRHYALYLMGMYAGTEEEERFRERWAAGGRKLDMGRSCLRFRSTEDLDLPLLTEAIASTPVDTYVERYEASRAGR